MVSQCLDQRSEFGRADVGGCGDRHPRHRPIPGRPHPQGGPVGGEHVAPTAVGVNLGQHADHGGGPGRRDIDSAAIGFGHRGDRGQDDDDRCGRLSRGAFVGFHERRLWHPLAQRRDQAGDPGQRRSRHLDHPNRCRHACP